MQRNSSVNGSLTWKRKNWHWYDGTNLDFVNWDELQPNSATAVCAIIKQNNGFWDDRPCSGLHRFICKKGTYSYNQSKNLTLMGSFSTF